MGTNRDKLATQVSAFSMLNRAIGDGQSGGFTRLEDGSIVFKGFTMNARGLQGNGTYEEWIDLLTYLFAFEDRLALFIGDGLVTGEREWGKTYEDMAAQFNRSYKTLRNYRWVCGAVELSLRRDNLSFSHYKEIAHIEEYESKAIFVDWAAKNGATVRALRAAVYEWEHPEGDGDTPLPNNWKGWKKSGTRIDEALRGNLSLTREEFETELQSFVNQARVMWASRRRK